MSVLHEEYSGQHWSFDIEGVWNEPPQDVWLGHVDYFELKSIMAQNTREELLALP